MNRTNIGLLMAAVLLVGVGWQIQRHARQPLPLPVPIPTPVPPKPPEPTIGDRMLVAINVWRKQHGCSELRQSDKLLKDAHDHSDFQAKTKRMGHFTADGSPGARLAKADYRWSNYGENVAWNQTTVDEVMSTWAWSPGHRANMVGNFQEFGGWGTDTGGGYYWTQVFASPGSQSRPSAADDQPLDEPYLEAPAGRLVRAFSSLIEGDR